MNCFAEEIASFQFKCVCVFFNGNCILKQWNLDFSAEWSMSLSKSPSSYVSKFSVCVAYA